ncbi:MAG: M48 family metallopeptidase [Anaerolineae bacterium]
MTSGGEPRTLVYGTRAIPYTFRYEERKTLGIAVHPDLSVVVRAPAGASPVEIEAVLQRRARWITRRLDDYARYSPDLPPRDYVSGETHRYLGRQYRLKVVAGTPEGVVLDRAFLVVTVADRAAGRAEALVTRWYRARAREVFEERLAACYPRVATLGVGRPRLTVRAMRTRWGSSSGAASGATVPGAAGRIALNIKLAQVPALLIDYVVLHELCHLVEPHHGRAFYDLLGKVLPDWRERRERLNRYEFG